MHNNTELRLVNYNGNENNRIVAKIFCNIFSGKKVIQCNNKYLALAPSCIWIAEREYTIGTFFVITCQSFIEFPFKLNRRYVVYRGVNF
jgi:hypothetical protein